MVISVTLPRSSEVLGTMSSRVLFPANISVSSKFVGKAVPTPVGQVSSEIGSGSTPCASLTIKSRLFG